MPYIAQPEREFLKDESRVAQIPGHLNYKMSQLIKGYLAMTGVSYTHLNAVIGVLECLKLEMYRRIAAPYEDKKMSENGEVF